MVTRTNQTWTRYDLIVRRILNMICKVAMSVPVLFVVVRFLTHVQLFWDPHELYPTRLLYPSDFPGKNTGEDCDFLLQGIFKTQGSGIWVYLTPRCTDTQQKLDAVPSFCLMVSTWCSFDSLEKQLLIQQQYIFGNKGTEAFLATK